MLEASVRVPLLGVGLGGKGRSARRHRYFGRDISRQEEVRKGYRNILPLRRFQIFDSHRSYLGHRCQRQCGDETGG